MRLIASSVALIVVAATFTEGQVRLADESDRAAFRAWFVFLADAQFYRQTADVSDCAALVRHAMREALRAHTPEWHRLAKLPLTASFPDVRRPPTPTAQGWPLFRTSQDPDGPLAEFADARTIIAFNARPITRDARAARPGDLLYFQQPDQAAPDHLMVFVGRSQLEAEADDWVVYHTGPSGGDEGGAEPVRDPGEVRKVRLGDLLRHPSPRWRPLPANSNFIGVFRLSLL